MHNPWIKIINNVRHNSIWLNDGGNPDIEDDWNLPMSPTKRLILVEKMKLMRDMPRVLIVKLGHHHDVFYSGKILNGFGLHRVENVLGLVCILTRMRIRKPET